MPASGCDERHSAAPSAFAARHASTGNRPLDRYLPKPSASSAPQNPLRAPIAPRVPVERRRARRTSRPARCSRAAGLRQWRQMAMGERWAGRGNGSARGALGSRNDLVVAHGSGHDQLRRVRLAHLHTDSTRQRHNIAQRRSAVNAPPGRKVIGGST
jgi:hypothetical protein